MDSSVNQIKPLVLKNVPIFNSIYWDLSLRGKGYAINGQITTMREQLTGTAVEKRTVNLSVR